MKSSVEVEGDCRLGLVKMSVVGFDIGNENCVIAVVKQGGMLDVLLNDESNRETPSVVSFSEKQRFLGSAGAASTMMNPKSTISQVKRLLGRKFREADVQNDLKLFPFETCESHDGGILVRLEYLGKTHTFSPVQILGMLLSNFKQITEKSINMPISNCVIGIPCYFTDVQRRAYLDAATIAGLRPLRLMHDCTATALGYGIYKTDFSNVYPTYVVFVDIGHCDTQVCVASFENGHMKILSHAFDASLGGRDFDEVLFSYFASQFKQHYDIDVYTNIKASIRLRASCEKLKKVLSANAEAPLNIECLMNEKDVKGFIRREEFEKMSSDLVERIRISCQKALADSGLTVEKIHSVELVGSGSRMPAISRILASLFNREPSRTMNASECVARGCALQCAMLSPLFRVREFEVQDSYPFSIGFSSDKGPICTLSNGMLFPRGQPFPSIKILTLHRTNTFQLQAFYADQNELLSVAPPQISSFMIGPFQTSHEETARIKIRVQLNLHGVVNVQSASLIEGYMDDSARRDGHSTLADDAKSSHAPASESDAEVDKVRKGKVPERMEIPVNESVYGGMTKTELSEAVEKERQFAQQDLKMERTKDKKNALESYVYEMRDKFSNMYRSFATESEREGISQNLQETEKWLYEDGVDESENIYTERLENLKKLVDPIENRYKNEEAQKQATRDLLKCSMDYQMVMQAHSLPSKVRDAVIDECTKAEQWLQEKIIQQDRLPRDADPILWSSEIKRKSEALDLTCKYIMKTTPSPPVRNDTNDSDWRRKADYMESD